jgi:hypothetical protein
MAKRQRKTAAQRREEKARAESYARSYFFKRLAAVNSINDLREMLATRTTHGSAEHRFYSNLEFFVRHWRPAGLSFDEAIAYIELARRLEKNGELKAETREGIEDDLRRVTET